MTELVYYVLRQRGGWGVEHQGRVRSGHRTREAAVETARALAMSAAGAGGAPCLRIQGEAGVWQEERSFAPRD